MNDAELVKTYKQYVGIKLHFNNDNYYFKGTDGLKLTVNNIMERNDKMFFVKLMNVYKNHTADKINFLVSCFKENNDAWIGDMFNEDYERVHTKRMKIINSINYYFTSDIDRIIDYMDDNKMDLTELLSFNNSRPAILNVRSINDETIAIIDKFIPFLHQNTENPWWKNKKMILHKYNAFLTISEKSYNYLDKLK